MRLLSAFAAEPFDDVDHRFSPSGSEA